MSPGRPATDTPILTGARSPATCHVIRWDPKEANSSRSNAQNEFNGPNLVGIGSNGRSQRALVGDIWPVVGILPAASWHGEMVQDAKSAISPQPRLVETPRLSLTPLNQVR